jgi:DNA-binding LacI/PurR family transcriptional regulator
VPTIKDIARELRLDSSTVSLGLRDDPKIAATTRARIHAAAARLGYVPNRAAQALRRGRSQMIAFVLWGNMPDEIRKTFPDYTLAATTAAFDAGYQLLLLQATAERLAATPIDRFPELRQADGALLVGETLDRRGLTALLQTGYPVVHLGERTLEGVDLPYVSADYTQGGRLAATHLLSFGHRRLAALVEPHPFAPEIPTRRLAGFAAGAGQTLIARRQVDRQAPLEDILSEVLARGITGIFTSEQQLALRLLTLCQARGIGVPGVLSIVTFDDTPAAAVSSPPLTCVRQPRDIAGRLGVGLLRDIIEGRRPPNTQMLVPCDLVLRASVERPPKEDA